MGKNFSKAGLSGAFFTSFYDLETVEIMPNLRWGKGEVGELALKFLRKKFGQIFLPVYIGDSTTDESAFRALQRGVTVKVGRGGRSAARYYVRSQAEVYKFLAWLESLD